MLWFEKLGVTTWYQSFGLLILGLRSGISIRKGGIKGRNVRVERANPEWVKVLISERDALVA